GVTAAHIVIVQSRDGSARAYEVPVPVVIMSEKVDQIKLVYINSCGRRKTVAKTVHLSGAEIRLHFWISREGQARGASGSRYGHQDKGKTQLLTPAPRHDPSE